MFLVTRGATMTMPIVRRIVCGCALFAATLTITVAQQPPNPAERGAQGRGGAAGARGAAPAPAAAPLFFRETWKQQPNGQQHPVTPDVVSNPSLELKLYGASAKEILVTGNNNNGGVIWLFSGLTTTPIAVTLRDKNNYVDLSGSAKIHWTIRTAGFHAARPVVKLADGTFLVGDHADMSPNYFNEIEFAPSQVRWLLLDTDRMVTITKTNGQWVENVDLTKVDEVGYADLMPSSGHGFGGHSSLGPIAVYGTPVKR